MTTSALEGRWLPILVAVLAADVNFWYFASTGENDADYLGILVFVLFGIFWGRRLLRHPGFQGALSTLGAVLATLMMVMRQTGTFDRGYIPPYAVFVAVTLLSAAFPG
jgi:hypothetical protein